MLIYVTFLSVVVSSILFFSIKSLIFRFYISINSVLFTLPAIIEIMFDVTHPMHQAESSIYDSALMFVIIWNIILGLSFNIFQKKIPTFYQISDFLKFSPIQRPNNYQSVYFSSIVLIFISVIAKWKLISMGGFQMSGVASSSPLLQLYKLFAIFDLLVLIYIGEFKKNIKNTLINSSLYILIAFMVLLFALFSGSRGQIIYALIVILVSHRELIKKNIILSTIAFASFFPFVFIVFPFMAFLRNNNFDFSAAIERMDSFIDGIQFIILDVLSTRLNYLEILGKVMDYVNENGIQGGIIYINNFIGLIPRAIWPSKPVISNDSHKLGHDLGILQPMDTTTSIGLRPIGEAYFELGIAGLVIAFILGIIFAFFHKQFSVLSKSPVAFSIYLYLILYLVGRDGIFAILPGLIYVFIGWIIFFSIMRFWGIFFKQIIGNLYQSNKSFNENL